jgi:hypothetical protein
MLIFSAKNWSGRRSHLATNALRNTLQDWLAHYKAVLTENGMSLPFSEIPL